MMVYHAAEADRIRKCRGRVFALHDEPEVPRVWLPNSDSPGLAMARAFGDFCLKDFGLISVPEVSYRRISDRDEFIVLATDGVYIYVIYNIYYIYSVDSIVIESMLCRYGTYCRTRKWLKLWSRAGHVHMLLEA